MAQEGWAVEQEEPMFCTNNCGLLGNPATMNLCSKCYEEARAKQQSYSTSKTLEETVKELSEGKSLEEPLTTQDFSPRRTTSVEPQTYACACLAKANLPPPPPAAPIRCSSCRKRVGLTGIKCRCGSVFCALHRYSDRHDCPFDYRTSARATIAKANPMVRAEKIRKL